VLEQTDKDTLVVPELSLVALAGAQLVAGVLAQ
jgi:hypothetical protein